MYTTNYDTGLPQFDLALNAVPQITSSILAPEFSQRNTSTNQTTYSQNRKPLPTVECISRARIPTTTGAELWLHVYKNDLDNKEHLAFVFGNQIESRSLNRVREGETELDRMIRGAYTGRLSPGRISSRDDQELVQERRTTPTNPMLVRVHSECYTGETTWSARCDCGEQLDEAAQMMIASGGGVIVYLRQEGRGIGLAEKLKAYNLQDMGLDTVDANLSLGHPADARGYGIATAVLVDLGLGNDSCSHGIRLLTNNPEKLDAIEGSHGEVTVKERVPMNLLGWENTRSLELHRYLQTKAKKMGHVF